MSFEKISRTVYQKHKPYDKRVSISELCKKYADHRRFIRAVQDKGGCMYPQSAERWIFFFAAVGLRVNSTSSCTITSDTNPRSNLSVLPLS